MNRWPDAVNINLWPYALRFANDVFNATHLSKLETHRVIFSSTPVRPQVLNCTPILSTYVLLHGGLQGGGKRPNKWVRLRMCILVSPATRPFSVALVLSLTTGYVSPQFHLKFDDFFETVQETKSLPRSRWQFLSKLVMENGRPMCSTPARVREPECRNVKQEHCKPA
jgi:hypothetical protein